jgi:tubulin--tyrosine ligase
LYSLPTGDAGKAYQIKDILRGRFYYPRDPGKIYHACGRGLKIQLLYALDGLGEFSDFPRDLKEGEIGEWILLDGVSPGSRSSCALSKTTTDRHQRRAPMSRCTTYTLARSTFWYVAVVGALPHIQCDHPFRPLIFSFQLSGPNLGRNTSCESVTYRTTSSFSRNPTSPFFFSSPSAAFALSSGTLGAALSSALSQTRSIALSYGTVEHPTPQTYFEPAHVLSVKIIRHLWNNWGKDEGGLRNGEIDLYSVNIPMIRGLLSEGGLPIIWTRFWRNSYHRLFEAYAPEDAAGLEHAFPHAGPDSTKTPLAQITPQDAKDVSPKNIGRLIFKFSPDMTGLLDLRPSNLPEGSDSWAFEKGWACVTPVRASFGEPAAEDVFVPGGTIQDRVWKIKL